MKIASARRGGALALVIALVGFGYWVGGAVASAASEYGPNQTAYTSDGDYTYVQQRINYTQMYPGGTQINQTEIHLNVLGLYDELENAVDSIYENSWTYVALKYESSSAYGWPMTYASTPDWDYFGWSHLGTLTETIRTDYRTEWSAGWNSTFNCCYAGWIHTKVSD